MVRDVLLDVGIGEVRLAVLENSELVEFYMEKHESEGYAGNIYRGRVERVLPGMQAAFVDIGLSLNAFLYVKDIAPAHYDENGEIIRKDDSLPPIADYLTAGQELTVQIIKEQTGRKGARVTTRLTIPGRFAVLLPGNPVVGISKRIENQAERARLRDIAALNKPENTGIIIRTASEDVDEQVLIDEIRSLDTLWQDIIKKEARGAVPRSLFREPGFVAHAVREYLQPDLNRFIINDRAEYERILELLEGTSPGLKMKLEYFSKSYDMFAYYHVESAIEEALSRKVWLKSGAYLVFDRTEALTVIDVNSGKNVGKTNLEETALKVNLEAAKAIARQIRLRDISGIILVDFIDMREKEHRDQVVATLKEAVKNDRTQTVVIGMTSLGLMEMTRKKIRQPLAKAMTVDCRVCKGRGWHISPLVIAKRHETRIARQMADTSHGYMEAYVHPEILKVLEGVEKENLERLEKAYSCKLSLKTSPDVEFDELRVRHNPLGSREKQD